MTTSLPNEAKTWGTTLEELGIIVSYGEDKSFNEATPRGTELQEGAAERTGRRVGALATTAAVNRPHRCSHHSDRFSAHNPLPLSFRLDAPCPDDVVDDPPIAAIQPQNRAAAMAQSRPPALIPNGEENIPLTRHLSLNQPEALQHPSPNVTTRAFDSDLVQDTLLHDGTSRSMLFLRQRSRFIDAKKYHKLVSIVVLQTILLLGAIIIIILQAQPNGNGDTQVHSNPPTTLSTLDAIRNRGSLRCGVVEYNGFSEFNTTSREWSGFEVDLCRAVGAAIFDANDNHVVFTNMTLIERFTLLESGQVDLLAAGVTYTMERDLYEPTAKVGFTFSVPYLYNGLSFAGQLQYVDCADHFDTSGNCTNLTICVQPDTTHEEVIERLFPGFSGIKKPPNIDSFYEFFRSGSCNVLAGEQFELAWSNLQIRGYSGSYNMSGKIHSKEPISLVTRDDDAEWSDFVNWVFLALLSAEKMNITQEIAKNVQHQLAKPIPPTPLSLYQSVASVGNYAELYNRHLESILPRTSMNQQNNGTTPLIYSFPFGNIATFGTGPVTNGTLERILQRGYLRCGFGETAFFASYNFSTQQWQGLDVDLCRAVSAAIFKGVVNAVFLNASSTDRWRMLANGDIDLIARLTTWNYERDVNESSTGAGFTFTQPYFYTGVKFGGKPPYGAWADNLCSYCTGLKICVTQRTTTEDVVRHLFNETYIILNKDVSSDYACLSKAGNVIAGESYFAARATVRSKGYNGSYQEGTKLFSRANLAVVTRQDDPQWSSFVNWIIMATFYASEQNITRTTYVRMPTTNILNFSTTILQDAIRAVGSYNEIVDRASAGQFKIHRMNTLNIDSSPLHYTPSGLFGPW